MSFFIRVTMPDMPTFQIDSVTFGEDDRKGAEDLLGRIGALEYFSIATPSGKVHYLPGPVVQRCVITLIPEKK